MKHVVGLLLFIPLLLAADEVARVIKVNDGDTFLTADSQSVRMLGIDAAESYQAGGDVVTEMLDKYIGGRTVRLERDRSDTDDLGNRHVEQSRPPDIAQEEAVLGIPEHIRGPEVDVGCDEEGRGRRHDENCDDPHACLSVRSRPVWSERPVYQRDGRDASGARTLPRFRDGA